MVIAVPAASSLEGRSSTGRSAVSKTAGCRFKSCRPCSTEYSTSVDTGRWPHTPDERHAVSDEPEGTGAVSTQPARPTGKRLRRGGSDDADTLTGAREAVALED